MSILEGFIKPTIDSTVSPTLNSNVDMSNETNSPQNTYNITIGTVVISDEAAVKIAEALARRESPPPSNHE